MPVISSRNRKSVTSFGNEKERELIIEGLEAAISSVSPDTLIENELHIDSDHIVVPRIRLRYDLKEFDKIIVIGGGKASGFLAQGLEQKLGKYISSGYVNILQGTKKLFHTKRIVLNEASHPVPDQAGVRGAREMVKLLRGLDRHGFAICLISGGGSSLMPLPAKGIALADQILTTDFLLRSGANIDQMNCVRKHISAISGGQLVREGNGARFLSLIISDVVGDHLESIASGPTAPDPTTFADAKRILSNLKLFNQVSRRVRRRIGAGCRGLIKDTPKPGDPVFSSVANAIIGSNTLACEGAKRQLVRRMRHPISVKYLGSAIVGEASLVARNLVADAQKFGKRSRRRYSVLVWGGETTVTVKGQGTGGRNQEQALSALQAIGETSDKAVTIGFFGTDGIDGKTEAAGALVDFSTYRKAIRLGLDANKYLKENDSNSFFRKVGKSLVITGPTGTNVNDIGIAVIARKRKLFGKRGVHQ